MANRGSSKRLELANLIKKAPSKQIDSVFIGLTYLLAVLLLVFAIVPTVNTIVNINKEIKEKGRINESLENKISALATLDEQYLDNTDAFKDLTLLFPASGNFSLFLSNIDAVVTRNNFILESISFSKYERDTFNTKTTVLKPWNVRMAVSGKKVYLITLLRDLEAMPMYPVLETVSYGSEVDDDGNTRYSISLRIYHVENDKFYD
ncbi:MAG: hypothetical protein RBT33_00150 [Candidatus Dojkabacteria bacterium]|jgi:hypothetical protein|nr:hypothetical protein [Candidatus Dojkabacteria bacterium]